MTSDHSISHHESHCPVNGCPVCMPPIAIGVSPREYEALQSIAKAARTYFREFDHLIGDWDEHAYPERRGLADALDAYDSPASDEEHHA